MNDYNKGLLITLCGVLIITPDSLLIRLIDANSWTILMWRNGLCGLLILGGLWLYYRNDFIHKMRSVGWPGLLMALTWALGTLCFIYSIKATLVANTLFIVSTSPVFAALIAWLVLREAVTRRTWLTIIASLLGIGIIAWGSLEQGDSGSLLGDLAALVTAVMVAISFSIARHYRQVSMIPAVGISSILAAVMGLPLAEAVALTQQNLIAIALIGLLVAPLGISLMVIGPRYLPATDVSLLILLEAVFGPLWVWWMLDEFPGVYTLVGGTLVLTALAVSNGMSLWRGRRRAVRAD